MEADYGNELENLLATIKKNCPEAKLSLVEEAFWLAKSAHENQKRESGEDFFSHPLAVSKMLAEKGLDEAMVSAALLHDTIEDTRICGDDLEKKFGKGITRLVEGVTKLENSREMSRQEQSTASMIKTIMASAKDIRVLVIKLFDKLHNMRTISHLSKEKQRAIAADALTIYVPLAHQLGMHELKYELEDLCFKVLEPEKFRELEKKVKASRKEKSRELQEAWSALKKKFPGTKWRFEEMKKSIYTIYSKMVAQNKQLKEMNDTLILKITVESADECYKTLGKVHGIFKPIPKKMKDFFAIPEFMIYRSLHTQVIGPKKRPMKAYIFCNETSDTADNGVVSLLRPSSGGKQLLKEYEKMFAKIASPKARNSKELADTLDLGLQSTSMIVFTSEGQIQNLPLESTALDFAYFIGEKKAKFASKAEINGKISSMWTKLNTGDSVRVHYALTPQFSSAWRGFVNSEKARRIIEKELKMNNISKETQRLVKFEIEAIDRPGLLAEQSALIAKNGLDMEVIRGICSIEKKTCKTEIFIRNSDQKMIQRTASALREMQETLGLKVDYLQ